MSKSSGRSPLQTVLLVLGIAFGVGVLCNQFVSMRRGEPGSPQVAPLVLQIQSLGQLHTVRYRIHDIYEHEKALKPEGWVRNLPGADRVYEAATRNSVLLVAEGSVEAGIDLTQVKPESVRTIRTAEGIRWRVRLPRAILYPPDVRVRVEDQKRGLFWNDKNIIPDATEAVKRRYTETTRASGILATAETNAVRMLTDMQRLAGNPNVEFVF